MGLPLETLASQVFVFGLPATGVPHGGLQIEIYSAGRGIRSLFCQQFQVSSLQGLCKPTNFEKY
jgi:hypothetical protein